MAWCPNCKQNVPVIMDTGVNHTQKRVWTDKYGFTTFPKKNELIGYVEKRQEISEIYLIPRCSKCFVELEFLQALSEEMYNNLLREKEEKEGKKEKKEYKKKGKKKINIKPEKKLDKKKKYRGFDFDDFSGIWMSLVVYIAPWLICITRGFVIGKINGLLIGIVMGWIPIVNYILLYIFDKQLFKPFLISILIISTIIALLIEGIKILIDRIK